MHIVPLIVGDERAAMRLCQEAIERGVFAQAIRPPTVPAGSSRLRLTAMASHTASELEMAATVFGRRGARDRAGPRVDHPALPERQQTIEELDEREPAYAERARRAALHRATVVTHARADATQLAPFDLERDATAARRSRGRRAERDADARRAEPGIRRRAGPRERRSRAERGPDAPFDFERELHDVRAA